MERETVNVDYHFHPNFPRSETRSARKARQIYGRFEDAGIGAAIVMEHVYKDFRRAWEVMAREKPRGFTLVPGVEYITAEGIDVCMFSQTPDIYDIVPEAFALSFEEVIDFLRDHPLVYCFVTHPFTLGTTSIISKRGHEFTRYAIEEIGAVEGAYTVYAELDEIIRKLRLGRLFAATRERISHNENLPEHLLPENLRFLAAGSDAHFPWHIGTHAVVPLQYEDVFYSITHNTSLVVSGDRDLNFIHMILSGQITFEEWFLKRIVRLRRHVRARQERLVKAFI